MTGLMRFALGALRGHGVRTGLSLLGVAVGVASVLVLTSLGEGARIAVMGEFSSLGSNLLIVIPGRTETAGAAALVSRAPRDLTLDDMDAIVRGVPGVRRAAPVVMGGARVRAGNRSRSVTVIGTSPEMKPVRKFNMRSGQYLPRDGPDAPVCVLGSKVASELFGARNPLGETIRAGDMRLRVIGVTSPRGPSIGMNLDEVVHVPVRAGLQLFDTTSLFRILVEVRSPREIEAAKDHTLALIQARHDGMEDITVLTQDSVLATFGRILNAITLGIAGIAAISLAVAGIGIMNVMLVSVSERVGEIGLLKAVGVAPRQILAVFLVETVVLSAAGGLLGLAAGLGIAAVIRSVVPAFPVEPPLWAIWIALGLATAVGLVFGIAPARKAAALDPVDALRKRQ